MYSTSSQSSSVFSLTALVRQPVAWLKSNHLLVSGGLFFVSTTVVNLGNYAFNLLLGRRLGPTLFADLSVMITLLLILTFATTALSTTTAKFTAAYAAQHEWASIVALRTWLARWALIAGSALMLMCIGCAPLLQTLLRMHSAWPFVVLGCGLPLFFVLAIERGVLQGQANFSQLAWSQQAEMWVRLAGAIGLVALGLSVNGAVAGVVFSFGAAWLVARRTRIDVSAYVKPLARAERVAIIRYTGPVLVGLLGQMVINNSDILLVKGFFPSQAAGQYAALALIGRMVFFATWSVVTVMFPLVTQRQQRGEAHRILLWVSLGIVAVVSCGIIVASLAWPELVVDALFGKQYVSISALLWLYALATAFYALANVIVTYHLSLGNGKGNYLVLGAGIAQVGCLLVWHTTLWMVVFVQVCIMAALLVLLLVWQSKQRKG